MSFSRVLVCVFIIIYIYFGGNSFSLCLKFCLNEVEGASDSGRG